MAQPTAQPSMGQRFGYRYGRLNRRLRSVRYLGFTPTAQKSRQLYQGGIVVCSIIGLVMLGSWATSQYYFIQYTPLEQAALVGFPFVLTVIFAWAYIALMYLYRQADQLYLGELDPYPFAVGRFESYQTIGYEDADGNVKFITWHAIRANVLLGGAWKLPAVVAIAPTRNQEYDKKLLDIYKEKKRVPVVPPTEWAGRLHSYIKVGRRYEIPGAVHPYVLGGDDPSLDPFRAWISRTIPKVGPLTVVILITDTIPEGKVLEGAQPSVHVTNEEWVVADLDREIINLRAQLHKTRRYNRKGERLESGEEFRPELGE